jgi:hypothetical protein
LKVQPGLTVLPVLIGKGRIVEGTHHVIVIRALRVGTSGMGRSSAIERGKAVKFPL